MQHGMISIDPEIKNINMNNIGLCKKIKIGNVRAYCNNLWQCGFLQNVQMV